MTRTRARLLALIFLSNVALFAVNPFLLATVVQIPVILENWFYISHFVVAILLEIALFYGVYEKSREIKEVPQITDLASNYVRKMSLITVLTVALSAIFFCVAPMTNAHFELSMGLTWAFIFAHPILLYFASRNLQTVLVKYYEYQESKVRNCLEGLF